MRGSYGQKKHEARESHAGIVGAGRDPGFGLDQGCDRLDGGSAFSQHGGMTIQLPASTAAWGTPAFAATLKSELEHLPPGQLPLQQGLSSTSVALEDDVQIMVIRADEEGGAIQAKVGVFYTGILAGCSCANDPTPTEPQNEYCELVLTIDPRTAQATAKLVADTSD